MAAIPDCDPEVYKDGKAIVMLATMSADDIEELVKKVREASKQKVDWHYVGGRAIVRYIGDRAEVAMAIRRFGHLYDEGMRRALSEFKFWNPVDGIPPMYWFEEE
jgi:hypothetical protein